MIVLGIPILPELKAVIKYLLDNDSFVVDERGIVPTGNGNHSLDGDGSGGGGIYIERAGSSACICPTCSGRDNPSNCILLRSKTEHVLVRLQGCQANILERKNIRQIKRIRIA